MKNKKVILSSILSLVFCLSLIAGGTFALFTSESKTNIAVTSGKVKVVAEFEDFKMYSLNNINTTTYEGEKVDRTTEKTFITGGTATVEEKSIVLDRVAPGDSVEFDIALTNYSNIAIKYRTIVQSASDDALFNGLEVTIDGDTFGGHTITSWESLEASTGEGETIKDIHVTITFPASAIDEYQGKTTEFVFAVEAIQGNASPEDGCGATHYNLVNNYDNGYHWQDCTVCGAIVNKEAHTMSSNDCTVEGTCNGCEYVRAAGEHIYEYTTTETEHTYTCSSCDDTGTVTHSYEKTTSDDGLTDTYACICGYSYDDVYVASVNETRYKTLDEALNSITDGDVVTIAAGTYADDVQLTKAATYNGNGNVTFTGNVTVGDGATVTGCTFATPLTRSTNGATVSFNNGGMTLSNNIFDGVNLECYVTGNAGVMKISNNEFKNGAGITIDFTDKNASISEYGDFTVSNNTMNGGTILIKNKSNYGGVVSPTMEDNANAVCVFYNMNDKYGELDFSTADSVTYYNSINWGEGVTGTLKVLPEGVITADALNSTAGEQLVVDDNGMYVCSEGNFILEYVDAETDETKYLHAVVENKLGTTVTPKSIRFINNLDELKALREEVNAGTNNASVEILQTANIDLNNEEWTPIGTSTHPFSGIYNGQGFTVSNLKISSGDDVGLFGYIKGSSSNYTPEISNLTIENVDITGVKNGGAFFGGGVYALRNTWYGGVQNYHNLTLKGNVKIEGENVGGIGGAGWNDGTKSAWLDVRVDVSNITIDVQSGSYVQGTKTAGGAFASLPHCDNVSNITSNINVKGSGIVGGIAGVGGWNWDAISCSGNVSLTTNAVETPYSIGTIFGSIADNTYWSTHEIGADFIDTYDDLINMTNLTATGTLTIKETITSNGTATNMIGTALFTENTFNYVGDKVVKVEPEVAE